MKYPLGKSGPILSLKMFYIYIYIYILFSPTFIFLQVWSLLKERNKLKKSTI